MKIEKFLLCENPMTQSGEYILHTRKPAMLLQVVDATEFNENTRMDMLRNIPVYGSTEVEGLDFIIYPLIYFDKVEISTQTEADKLAGLMRRAADWWHAYIKFEENFNKT
jgi:hypothetical protein